MNNLCVRYVAFLLIEIGVNMLQVEVLYVINPHLQGGRTDFLYRKIMSNRIAELHLPSSLMKFYTDVEVTGASTEFYDKFTIRYHISIIIKSMWDSPLHRYSLVKS